MVDVECRNHYNRNSHPIIIDPMVMLLEYQFFLLPGYRPMVLLLMLMFVVLDDDDDDDDTMLW